MISKLKLGILKINLGGLDNITKSPP